MSAGPSPSFAARVLIALVRLYQRRFAWLLGGRCRFQPSCSRYAIACIQNVGARRGAWLAIKRLARCQPLCPGGDDPPPEAPGAGGGHELPAVQPSDE